MPPLITAPPRTPSLDITRIPDDVPIDQLLASLGGSPEEISNGTPHDHDTEHRRTMRLALRDHTTRACSRCGTVPRGAGRNAQIWVTEDEDGRRRARTTGPVLCRSPHACPVCSPTLRAEAAAELRRVVLAARAQGHDVYMLTLTVRHTAEDDLALLKSLVTDAWGYLTYGAKWRRLRSHLRLIGSVRSLETTYGRCGWHPHLHVLLVTRANGAGASKEDLAAQRVVQLEAAWLRAVEHALVEQEISPEERPQYLPAPGRAATLVEVAGTGDYAMKGSDIPLSADSDGDSRSVWQIMRGAATGDANDQRLWKEYAEAIKGQHLLPGLAALKKALRVVEERIEQPSPPSSLVAEVPAPLYNRLLMIEGAVGRVERAAAESGLEGVAAAVVGELHAEFEPGGERYWQAVRQFADELRPATDNVARDPKPLRDDSPKAAPTPTGDHPRTRVDRVRRIVLLLHRRREARRQAPDQKPPRVATPGGTTSRRLHHAKVAPQGRHA